MEMKHFFNKFGSLLLKKNGFMLLIKFHRIRILTSNFRKHVKEKHFYRGLACNECEFETKRPNELKLHKEKMHLGIRYNGNRHNGIRYNRKGESGITVEGN